MPLDHRLLALAALAAALGPGRCAAADADPPRWNVELKRQNTERGTTEESTKTTLRFDALGAGAFALLRLDLPFPDAKQDFAGSPFDPRLGDIKLRADPLPLAWGGVKWQPRVELTLPTADPDTLGARKWQLGLGARGSAEFARIAGGTQRLSYGLLLQQTVAIAGDAAAKDINYSKFELELLDTWNSGWSAKLTLKPVVDWVLDGKTGAVLELEGGVLLAHGWRLTLMGGARVWGPAVASTYGKRLELTVARRF